MFKKLIFSTLASIILFVSLLPFLTKPAHAQVWYDQSPQEWFVKVYDPDNPTEIFGERYTAAQVQWVAWGLFSLFIPGPLKPVIRCFIVGEIETCISAINDLFSSQAPTNQNYYAKENIEEKSLLASIFEDRPLSGITYVKNAIRKFHLIPETQAQTGFGYQGLGVVRDLWTASRNIAYFFFVIAIVIMAFMIMFRVKVSPQVVITVQSALPKIVIALVLVTFSYAIAGFLVDLMYIVIGIISLLISQSDVFLATEATTMFNWLTKGAVTTPLGDVSFLGIFGMLALYTFLFVIILFYSLLFGGGLLEVILGTQLTLGALPGAAAILTIIAGIVLMILIIFISFKIIWTLLKAFASVLLLTIVAPFQIAAGIFVPGVGLGSWARSFVGNLAVFPLTGLLITLAFIFLLQAFDLTSDTIIPNFIQNLFGDIPDVATSDGWPPLLGVGNRTMSLTLIGVSLAMLFIVPSAADIIKGLIQGRPFAYGTAIGQAIGPLAWGAAGAEILAGRKIAGVERVAGEGRAVGWEVGKEIASGVKRRIQGLGR